ncbi:MAG: glycerol kinase GlpK [Bacteriovoracaceae bacterium]|nr:glycerol kinase GlpK [Bacteriovoracaceae bacterium]
MGFILAIDQGTTGTTCVLISDTSFDFIDKINIEHQQIFPRPGMVEHDLNEIWENTQESISALLKKNQLDGSEIRSIGITNQRETTCAFDGKGNPLHNAIVWQDRRTAAFCQELKKNGNTNFISTKTGLPIDPYFSATKMNWLLNNSDQVSNANSRDDLKLGTIDTFLLYKLTEGTSFKTEASNASRTLLMDLKSCQWSRELLEIFGIEKSTLPEIVDSFGIFGKTKGLDILPDGIPIAGILGDQQAALFGQAGIHEGDIKCTYGTGAFMLLNTGENIKRSSAGLLSTVAYKYQNKTVYALEGSTYIAGAAVQWLRDNLGLIENASEVEALAREVENLDEMEHLLFLPYFTGIGSPHWDSDAKAAIIGLTRDSKDTHLARATLDGIALSINELVQVMKEDTGLDLNVMKVDGGAVSNNLLMHIQATTSNLEIVRPEIIETTAYGAGLAAAIGSGIAGIDKINSLWRKDKSFDPNPSETDFYRRKKVMWAKMMKKLYL